MNEAVTESANKIDAYVWRDGTLDLCPVVDAQEWIDDRLEKNELLDAQYVDYCEVFGLDLDYNSALQFAESLEGKGIYGDGEPIVVNTYNGECLLSEVLQYVYWTDENGPHVLLQIQGGGDPRGNYPSPDAYDCMDDEGIAIFDNARGTIYCDDCDKHWDTDDANHWNNWDSMDQENLEDYQASENRPEYHPKPNLLQKILFNELPEQEQKDSGIVWIDDDRRPHCPFCGGMLRVTFSPAS